jgi:hypothetical protein
MTDEQLRTVGWSKPLVLPQVRVADPDGCPLGIQPAACEQPGEHVADLIEIWQMLPALKDLPMALLQQLPRSEIFQLNTALVKESKSASKVQANAKLMMNAQQLENNPVRVEAGYDDRKRVLHHALPGGASCSPQQFWLEAREVLGPKGVLPLGNYDLDTVGCGGCVEARRVTTRARAAKKQKKTKTRDDICRTGAQIRRLIAKRIMEISCTTFAISPSLQGLNAKKDHPHPDHK